MCLYAYMYVCMYMHSICMYVYICMCVYMLFPQSKNIIENINEIKLMVHPHHGISSNLY